MLGLLETPVPDGPRVIQCYVGLVPVDMARFIRVHPSDNQVIEDAEGCLQIFGLCKNEAGDFDQPLYQTMMAEAKPNYTAIMLDIRCKGTKFSVFGNSYIDNDYIEYIRNMRKFDFVFQYSEEGEGQLTETVASTKERIRCVVIVSEQRSLTI